MMNGAKFLEEWCAAGYGSKQRENLLKRVTKLDLAYLAQGEHQQVLQGNKNAEHSAKLSLSTQRRHDKKLAELRVAYERRRQRILETLLQLSCSETDDADALRQQMTLLINRIVEDQI